MSAAQAKFHDDLEAVTSELDLGVKTGRYSWEDVQKKVRERTGEIATRTDQYVQEYAWTTLGLAAGLGILLGLLMVRR